MPLVKSIAADPFAGILNGDHDSCEGMECKSFDGLRNEDSIVGLSGIFSYVL